jgi:UDP-N-acetylglucosamine transferase subunit ALG13
MAVPEPLVVVLLGTDHHPFGRLLAWVSDVARVRGTRWFVQHGSTTLPIGLVGTRMLGAHELQELLAVADAVVTHGGPGLIMEARACGHRPVVVPRDPGLGEHVDDHQLLFTARLAAAGLVVPAGDRDQFVLAVDAALAAGRTATPAAAGTSDVSRRFGRMVDSIVRER